MKSSVIITVTICFTAIVLGSIGALAFIAVGRDGSIVPQVVSVLGGIISGFTVLVVVLGKDMLQNVMPVLGKSVQTSTTVTTPPIVTASPGSDGGTPGAS